MSCRGYWFPRGQTMCVNELDRYASILVRSETTILDHSLKDAKELLESIPNPPTVTLVESDRGAVRDISFCMSWDDNVVRLKMIASDRFFAYLATTATIKGVEVDWLWDSEFSGFVMDNQPEELRLSFWYFLRAITEVL